MKTMLFVVTHKFVPTLNKGRNFIGVGENRNINLQTSKECHLFCLEFCMPLAALIFMEMLRPE